MENSKFYSLLGFAAKSRNIVNGSETCIFSMKKGKAKLIILSGDTSDNTKEKIIFEAEKNNVPYRIASDSDKLSHITGTSGRNVFAVTDEHFAECILAEIDKEEGGI